MSLPDDDHAQEPRHDDSPWLPQPSSGRPPAERAEPSPRATAARTESSPWLPGGSHAKPASDTRTSNEPVPAAAPRPAAKTTAGSVAAGATSANAASATPARPATPAPRNGSSGTPTARRGSRVSVPISVLALGASAAALAIALTRDTDADPAPAAASTPTTAAAATTASTVAASTSRAVPPRTYKERPTDDPFEVAGVRWAVFAEPNQPWTKAVARRDPGPGKRWVTVAVRARNLARTGFDPRTIDYLLLANGGQVVAPAVRFGTGNAPFTKPRPIGQDEVGQAELVFKVDEAASGLSLLFNAGRAGTGEPTRIDLGG